MLKVGIAGSDVSNCILVNHHENVNIIIMYKIFSIIFPHPESTEWALFGAVRIIVINRMEQSR